MCNIVTTIRALAISTIYTYGALAKYHESMHVLEHFNLEKFICYAEIGQLEYYQEVLQLLGN